MSLRLLIGNSMRRVTALSARLHLRSTVRTRLVRVAAMAALSTIAVVTVGVGSVFPTPAYAAVPTSGFTGTGNFTVPPSTATPLFQGVSDSSPFGRTGQYLYAAMKDPKKMAALTQLYRQAQAGTATASQAAELTTAVRSAAPLATGVKGVLGPLGAIATSAQVGFLVGGGVSNAMGLDVDGTLCSGGVGGQMLAVVSMTDCKGFWDLKGGLEPNPDVKAGSRGENLCLPAVAPVSACGQWLDSYSANNGWGNADYHMFKVTSNMKNSLQLRSANGDYYSLRIIYTSKSDGKSKFAQVAGFSTDSPSDVCPKGSSTIVCGQLVPAGDGIEKENSVSTLTGYQWWRSPNSGGGDPQPVSDRSDLQTSSGDPLRVQKCRQSYTDGSYDDVDGSPYQMSKGMPSPPEMKVPAGKIVKHIDCTLHATDGTAPDTKSVDTDTSPQYQKTAAVNPDCGSTTVCELQLVRPDGKVCNDTTVDCADWQSSPDLDKWQCRYGNEAIGYKPMSMEEECGWYANRWDPEAVRSGNTVTIPASQSPTKQAEPVANPKPEANPNTDKGQMGSPVADPDQSTGECFPTGWGVLNPVAWVLQPAKCALQWAFVPRASVMNKQMNDMQAKTDKSGIGSFNSIVSGFTGFVAPSTVCQGPPLTINYFGQHTTAYPFSSCDEPMRGVAATIRTILGGVMCLGALLAIVRYVTSIFGGIQFGGAEPESKVTVVDSRTGEVL